jgi:colicin import membrane protein
MSYAGTFPDFAFEHRGGIAVSVVGHVAILLAMSTSVMFTPKQPLPQLQLAIEAVVIDEGAIKRAAAAERRRTEAAAQLKRDEKQRKRAQQQRIAQQEKDRQAADLRSREAAAAESEKQRQAKERQVEEARQAEQRALVEKQQLEAKQRALEERKQREAETRAEDDRQRMLAAAESEEQERREAELRTSMQEEEALQMARQSGEMSLYLARIQQQVERNWDQPASAKPGLECEVAVVQLPNGDVISVRTISCNGDDTVKRSIEAAVRRASPLPLPENRVLFDRNLSFTFRPE